MWKILLDFIGFIMFLVFIFLFAIFLNGGVADDDRGGYENFDSVW
jgi:hypothetical protein